MPQMKRSRRGSARTAAQDAAVEHNWAIFQLSGMFVQVTKLHENGTLCDSSCKNLLVVIQASLDELRTPCLMKGK